MFHDWWPGTIALAVLLVTGVVLAAVTGHWAMWAWVGVVAGLAVYIPLYLVGQSGAVYEVGGVRFVFAPSAEYRPRSEMAAAVDEWWRRGGSTAWEVWASDHDYQRDDLVGDVTVIVREGPLRDPLGREALGMTYPEARETTVASGYATDMGVLGHELDLQAVHAIRGDAPERIDIEWLKREGLR